VPLLDDRVLVILPAIHPLAGAKEQTLDQLSHEPWILSTRCHAEMQLAFAAAGFTPNVALVTDDYYRAVPRLVADGSGGGPGGWTDHRSAAQASSALAGRDLSAGGAAGGRASLESGRGEIVAVLPGLITAPGAQPRPAAREPAPRHASM